MRLTIPFPTGTAKWRVCKESEREKKEKMKKREKEKKMKVGKQKEGREQRYCRHPSPLFLHALRNVTTENK